MTPTAPSPRSAAEQTRLEGLIADMFERHITFNSVLGLRLVSLDPANVACRLDMRPELVGHYTHARLHGGVIAATLDTLGGLALMVGMAHKHGSESAEQVMHRYARVGTIDLRTDFLRQGKGAHFIGQAQVTRLGGRIGSTLMQLRNDAGELIATAAASYIVS